MRSISIFLFLVALMSCTNVDSESINGFTSDGRKYELTPTGNDSTHAYLEFYADGSLFRRGEFQAMKKIGTWEEYYPDGDLKWLIENWDDELHTGFGCDSDNVSLSMVIYPKPENGILKAGMEYFLKPSYRNVQDNLVQTYCSGCESFVYIGNDSKGLLKLLPSPEHIGEKLAFTFELNCFNSNTESFSTFELYQAEFLIE